MYEYLFDIYQKWLIDYNESTLKKFFKLPAKTIFSLILYIVLLIATLYLLLCWSEFGNAAIISALLIEILSCIMLNSQQRDFIKNRCKIRLENHITYCNELRDYLINQFKEFNQKESYFSTLKSDLDNKISELQKKHDDIFKNINSVFHILLIPISVTLISGISNKNIPITDIIITTITITLITLTVYLIVWSIASVVGFVIKYEMNKYKKFASDIGCIIDIKSPKTCIVKIVNRHRCINKH